MPITRTGLVQARPVAHGRLKGISEASGLSIGETLSACVALAEAATNAEMVDAMARDELDRLNFVGRYEAKDWCLIRTTKSTQDSLRAIAESLDWPVASVIAAAAAIGELVPLPRLMVALNDAQLVAAT